MIVFKAKQLKGKLIFSYEEDERRYLCWTVLSRCFEEHDIYDRTLYLKRVLGTAEKSGKFCYPVCWAS